MNPLDQMDNVTFDQLEHALYTRSFKDFSKLTWGHLQPKTRKLKWNWHHDCVCDHLQAIHDGTHEGKHTIFVLPPRHTKSTLTSHYFQPFDWFAHPHHQYISAAYAQRRAEKDSKYSRRILMSDWYRRLVEGLPEDLQHHLVERGAQRFVNNRGGERLSMGMGGVSGENADIILIDDCLSSTEIHSDAAIIKLGEWWRETISSRFNDPETGRYIIIGQRLCKNDIMDLIFEFEDMKDWNRVVLPSLYEAEHPTPFYSVVTNPLTKKAWVDPRQPGDALFPNHYSKERLLKIKESKGSRVFNSQHQARPATDDGDYFQRVWLEQSIISMEEYKQLEFETTFQSWDTAHTKKKLEMRDKGGKAAESVCTTWSLAHYKGDEEHKVLVLRDIYADMVDMPTLRKDCVVLYEKWKPDVFIIENEASGRPLVQEMQNLGMYPYAFSPREFGAKEVRATSSAPMVAGGAIKIPMAVHNKQYFIDCLVQFPNAGKDLTDSTTQMLIYARKFGLLQLEMDPEDEKPDSWDSPYVKSEAEHSPYI